MDAEKANPRTYTVICLKTSNDEKKSPVQCKGAELTLLLLLLLGAAVPILHFSNEEFEDFYCSLLILYMFLIFWNY